jgi:hypothetical protein
MMTPQAGLAPTAALALHRFLVERHLRGCVLIGPDSGVRLNYRLGRFVKSYARRLPWRDDLCYLQAQGYWTLANWRLWELAQGSAHRDLAEACARAIVDRQRPDGAWDYPNPEWRGRIATAEGSWAAIGLVETYRRTEDRRFLEAALRWHRFLEQRIGWTPAPGGQAVNYFAGRSGSAVPNNSALVLRLLAGLAAVTGDERFLERCEPMVSFLTAAQRASGELPYAVDTESGAAGVEHFQCFQYSAFQALDLARYEAMTGDLRAAPLVAGLARFLRRGVVRSGAIPYACGRPHPQVTYHLAAVSAALAEGARRGIDGCAAAEERVRARVLSLQSPAGGFPHSRNDYGVLADRRSYPRNLAMILLHLIGTEAAVAVAVDGRTA